MPRKIMQSSRINLVVGVALAALYIFATQISANEIYYWIDANGDAHLTDDFNSIPKKNRPNSWTEKIVHLSWDDNSGNEEGFRVYKISDENLIMIADVDKNITTYTTSYIDAPNLPKPCYSVTAFNAAGESLQSNVACVPEDPAS